MTVTARIAAAFLIAAATAAAAAETGESRFEVTLDGEDHILEASGEEAAELTDDDGFKTLSLGAQSDEGAEITLVFGPYSGDALPDNARLEWRGDTHYAASNETGGELAVRNAEVGRDGSLAFSFGGLVVPVEIIPGGALAPVEAGQGVEIEGSFTGRVPQP